MTTRIHPEPGRRAENVYQFIKNYHIRHGYAPSRREIGRGCKIASISNVNAHLTKLVKEGRLEITAGVARGIRLVDEPGEGEWVVLNQLAAK